MTALLPHAHAFAVRRRGAATTLAAQQMPLPPRASETSVDQSIPHLTEERLLALAVAGRAHRQGEPWRLAQLAWRELAARYLDRVLGWTEAFEFPGHPGVRVPRGEEQDAAQEAFVRAVSMLGNFRGTTLPEFRKALRTCTSNTCMDYCRRTLARERRLAGSINDPLPGEGDDARGRFDAQIGDIEARRESGRAQARDDLSAVAAAIARLDNSNMQAVLRRTVEGATSQQIAEELGLTVANVDQLRRRGLLKLKEMLGDD